MDQATREEALRSFYRVRQTLGWLGLFLPVLLVLGGLVSLGHVEPSLSDYYHTVLRDIFVGIMFAISIFLIAYPGHARRGEIVSDDAVTTLAGFAGFGVALFPNEKPGVSVHASVVQDALGLKGAALAHYSCAFVFLGALGWICLVKFARTASPTRRRIYRACGWTILVMTLAVSVASIIKIWGSGPARDVVVNWMLVLWFEAVAVWAFSIAWLTKGRADVTLARLIQGPEAAANDKGGGP